MPKSKRTFLGNMVSSGTTYTSPLPPAPRVTRPWRIEDLPSALVPPPQLRAECIASFSTRGRRVDGASTCSPSSMELEIEADARVVSLVHRNSHIVERTFRFQVPVVAAVLAQFPRTESSKWRCQQNVQSHPPRRSRLVEQPLFICILVRSDCVSVYAPNGESYDVALPFHADRLVSLPPEMGGGLLLQRRPLTQAPSAAAVAAAFSPSSAKNPITSHASITRATPLSQPRYFTLAHPLEEVKPVAISSMSRAQQSGTGASGFHRTPKPTKSFLSDAALDLVDVCALPPLEDTDGDWDTDDQRSEPKPRALLVCFHRHEKRFAVYEMKRHVHQREENVSDGRQDTNTCPSSGTESNSNSFASSSAATPPRFAAASYVSPAKARQQQRELVMTEQYVKSHIVPDHIVQLVWTSPTLDAFADSYPQPPSTSREGSRGSTRRAFLISSDDDDTDTYGGGGVTHRLALVDGRVGVLLLKPVRSSAASDSGDLLRDRDSDLHAIRCRDAAPVTLCVNDVVSSTDVVILSRNNDKLFLFSVDRVMAEVLAQLDRVGSLALCGSSGGNNASFFTVRDPTNRSHYQRRYRHPLSIVGISSPVRTVLDVLRYALPMREFVKLQVATLAQDRSSRLASLPEGNDSSWLALRGVLLASAQKLSQPNSTEMDDDDQTHEQHGASKKARPMAVDDRRQDPQPTTTDVVRDVLGSAFAALYQYENQAVVGSIADAPSPSKHQQHHVVTTTHGGIDISVETMGCILSALHLAHEDSRLSNASQTTSLAIALLLCELCDRLGFSEMAAHYRRQHVVVDAMTTHGAPFTSPVELHIQLQFDDEQDPASAPPDVFLWLRDQLQGYASRGNSNSRAGDAFGGSFEAITTTTNASHYATPFPRLRAANEWKRSARDCQNPLWRTEAVCRVFELLFPTDTSGDGQDGSDDDDDDDGFTTGRRERKKATIYEKSRLTELMEFLTLEGDVGSRLCLEDIPVGVRFVILEAIRVYKEDPPRDVSERVAAFIGRRDLAGQYKTGQAGDDSTSGGATKSGSLIESTRLKGKAPSGGEGGDLSGAADASREITDGLVDVVSQSQRLFPTDQRLKEVARLVRSNRPQCLRLDKTSNMSDQDYIAQQQTKLLLLCKRSMALCVARGMVTLGTFDVTTVQNQAWQLSLPALPLAGRTPPTNATVLLDVSGYAKELTHWPQFHNGCATGLRLPAKDLSTVVTRYWIKYHRPLAAEYQRRASQAARGIHGNAPQAAPPQSQSATATARDLEEAHAAHAGVLLGLGLHGHLKCLSMADVYNYLSLSNEFITVAILLGMATTAGRARHKRSASSVSSVQAARRRRKARKAGALFDGATQDDNQLPTASQVAADTDVDMDANVDSTAPAISTQPSLSQANTAAKEPTTTTPLTAGNGLELSLERSVSKMLCLHIPSLLPPPFAEFSVPASTQTAALLGLGILYQGTGHRLMTELLLTEIARSPASAQFVGSHQSTNNSSSQTSASSSSSSTPFDQHEGYSLAAGLALGLVLLGRGGATSGDPGLADLGLEEKLYKYIVGGAAQPSSASSTSGGDANSGGNCLYRGRKWRPFGSGLSIGSNGGPRANNSSNPPGSSARGGGNNNGDPTKSSSGSDRSSWRGEHVNIGITACGSALALAFMYLKSGNKSIASQLAVPNTLVMLEYVRPDILLVRTLAKNLVLWDNIEPTRAWVETTEVPAQLREMYKLLRSSQSVRDVPEHTDIRSICESYASIVAGACFSMGLRFAGTCDPSARDTLRHFVVYFRDMRSRSALLGGDLVTAATNRVAIERGLAVCAQALALVDAGTGNLETLTLLRSINLRQRVDNELTYGNHMALSMAMGLLFLGGGRASVSRPNEAIAALVVALYPMAAMNTADNKYHLQAFRHLYVLAVDTSRHVETIDTTTGEPCSVDLRVESRRSGSSADATATTTTTIFKTPCLLPELDLIDRITVESTAFYPVDIRLQDQDEDGDGDDDDGGATAGTWSAPRSRLPTVDATRTTANDNRVKLLLDKSTILLERRVSTGRHLAPTAVSSTSTAVVATTGGFLYNNQDQHLLQTYHQYFQATPHPTAQPTTTTTDTDGSSDTAWWWRQHQSQFQFQSMDFSSSSLLTSRLPSQMSLLFEVFHLSHPQRRLDSLVGLWNLKLVQEFHRMDPFESLETMNSLAVHDTESNSSDAIAARASQRDVVEWLRAVTEEALRARWRQGATRPIASLAAAQQRLIDRTSPPPRDDDDHLLLAVFVFFDPPSSVWRHQEEWQRRMQMALKIGSRSTSYQNQNSNRQTTGITNGGGSGRFAVDRFLLQAQDHVTQEEQTFWLRVVSFFLFSV